jgi:FKBP-type peptidyl-prolyl cis-trans isomerase SlyD
MTDEEHAAEQGTEPATEKVTETSPEATMVIESDRVVSFHYTLSEQGSGMTETSTGGEPLTMLFGHRNAVAGVEAALEGHVAGDRFSVQVPPESGYGERGEKNVRRVSKKHIPNRKGLKAGDRTTLTSEQGQHDVTVLKVGRTVVDVDLNHPLAGRILDFDIEVVAVRAADAQELAHGHVHGPGGHGH